MGKKNRRTGAPPASAVAAETVSYPSDGPSQEESNSFQTSSASLQTKLDQLKLLAQANDRAGFVSQFVPLDLSPADMAAYLEDLSTAPEAEGQWTNLAAEIIAIANGKGLRNIEGDQLQNAIFFFEHPILTGCDREVSFVCTGGEWRAEG